MFLLFTIGCLLVFILLIREYLKILDRFNYKESLNKSQENQNIIWKALFFAIIVPLLLTSIFILGDSVKNNPHSSEQTINKSNLSNSNNQEADFGPYIKELQTAIKKNWNPPKGNENRQVVLLFSIAKDGRLLNIKIKDSSNIKEVDEAAVTAVKLTAPFQALPAGFKGDKVDIQFTFDYKVFGL